ncbi:MAG: hypothetical protein BGO11_02255, partial [Solirubrobacterales bacterium 70-9]
MGFTTAPASDLVAVIGADRILDGVPEEYLRDAAGGLGLQAHADAVVVPRSTEEVAAVVGWCDAHSVPVTPRGGGSGLAGGAVPLEGGVVLSLAGLTAVRNFDPLQWRIEVEAGLATAAVHRLARENGLYFPPDPGAAEQSQIGGNVATNAGGPHAFKYGVTGTWVTGIEIVTAQGEIVQLGGATRKDVAGYDLTHLLVGSEGTLGVITAVWLRLIPAPAARLPVAAFYPDARAGAAAIETVMGSGLVPAVLEYLDGGALAAVAAAYPGSPPPGAGFAVLAEADGEEAAARALRAELVEALSEGAVGVDADVDGASLWRWRDGVSGSAAAVRGTKLSEDIDVPVDRLFEAIAFVDHCGAERDLPTASWGHAGDGNIHASFLLGRGDEGARLRAEEAAERLFVEVRSMGGSLSGEHGIGAL